MNASGRICSKHVMFFSKDCWFWKPQKLAFQITRGLIPPLPLMVMATVDEDQPTCN